MIERVRNQANILSQTIAELRASGRPIALYGAGEVASKVYEILNRHDLAVDSVWVDQPAPGQEFNGIRVQSIDSIQDVNNFSVMVCIGNYKSAIGKLASKYRAQNIHLIENIYSLPEIDYAYVDRNSASFEEFYNALADERSRDVLIAFLNSRITGNPEHIFDYHDPCQYFPADIPGYPQFTEDETFVDCGAFVGDTLLDFVKHTNRKYRKVYAFEPDEKNHQALLATIQEEGIPNVTALRKGVSDTRETLKFVSREISSQVSDQGTTTIDVDTIDAVVGDEPVSFIKMDVEGYELEALRGAQSSIRLHRPKLAISVYHKPDDLIRIPQLIHSLNPDYTYYLRAHKCMSIDVVLYALPAA